MIEVAQDVEGVREAVLQLLEESFFQQSAICALLDRTDDEDAARILAKGPQRDLSPGYYKWAGYLLVIEEMRDCGHRVEGLQAIELNGLIQVRRARHEFNVAHPTCSCGNRLESRWVEGCDGCGAKFRKAA